ncbi:MAG: hypothetical protein KC776_06745 [Myxococcales bacterium]|nr:hypothetical protein [Myxococcales bacterium]MCB9579205.1 hypothetical protein [Polyangiaceae bacterium]
MTAPSAAAAVIVFMLSLAGTMMTSLAPVAATVVSNAVQMGSALYLLGSG